MSELSGEMRMISPATVVIGCFRKRVPAQVERGKQFFRRLFLAGSTFQFVTSESDQRTATSLADGSAECETPMSSSSDQTRRTLLLTA
jgi:hypothetical protein